MTATTRSTECPHATGRKAGEPVKDVKNAFHTALEIADINDFTWHDLRHTFASWLIRAPRFDPWANSWAIGACAW